MKKMFSFSHDPIHETLADMSSFDFRRMIVNFLHEEISNGRFDWDTVYETYFGTVDQWAARMSEDGEYLDQVFQQLTADFLNRQIISYSVIPNEGDSDRVVVNPREPSTDEPYHLLYFSDTNFNSPHYQSIRPLDSSSQANVQSTTPTTTTTTTQSNNNGNTSEQPPNPPLQSSAQIEPSVDDSRPQRYIFFNYKLQIFKKTQSIFSP